jgi:hypothetical protein
MTSPARIDPATDAIALTPDHSAMARVRAAPVRHSAVISDRVVGNAMPAASPVNSRATISISIVVEKADRKLAATVRASPATSSCLRP